MRTALCSYDAGILLAMGNYLTETDGFGRCVAFRSGAALLRELCAGQHFDTLVLDEQLLDMDAVTFLEQLPAVQGAARPLIVLLSTRQFLARYESPIYKQADCCFVKPFQIGLLARRIQSIYNGCSENTRGRCEALCRQWGVQGDAVNCGYLADAAVIAVQAESRLALRKEILMTVAELHGVSVAAVDSGLRRLTERLEQQQTPAYRRFKQQTGLGAGRPTVGRLLSAIQQQIECEAGEDKRT